MVLGNWLTFFEARLKLASLYRRRKLRRLRRGYSGAPLVCFAVAVETLEQRQLLAAAVTGVTPNTGTTQGGTSVNVVGSGFTNVMGVMFGSTPAQSYTVNSASAITAVAPSHVAGQVDIIVDTMSGNSSANSSDKFNFTQAAPTVTQVGPTSGGTAGGTVITVTGTNFTGASSVLFGTTIATSFTVTSSSSLMVTAPSHTAGMIDVTVVTSAGSSAVNPNDQYDYTSSGPTVTSISPGTGTGSGGTSITINGSGFSNVTGVKFGTTAATSYSVVSNSQITAISPSHNPGTIDVTVVTTGGTSATSSADQFVFTTPVLVPQVTSLVTTSGTTAGGTQVTIQGVNYTNITGVYFGSLAAASYVVNSSTSITAVTAAEAAGSVDVTVQNTAGTSMTSANDKFAFQSPAPVVTGLSATTGSTAGGTPVTITGSNFMGVTQVYFGSLAATSYVLNSPTSITAYSPAEAAGVVDVAVQTPGGTSAVSSADKFTFVIPPPVVASLNVTSGLTTGGTTITLTGSNFTGATAVSFGGTAAAAFTVVNATTITAVTPAMSNAGTVDVTVATGGGTSSTSLGDQFTFLLPAPTVTSLSTTTGSTQAGTTVNIIGTNFANVIGVSFGSVAAGYFEVNSPTSITAYAAAQAAGTVDVTVTTKSGTSATSSADQFTFAGSSGSGSGSGSGSNGGGSNSSSTAVPTVSSLSSTSGSANGGDSITIFGTNLSSATGVSFVIPASGDNPAVSIAAASFTIASDGAIVAVTPTWPTLLASAVTVNVTIQSAAGTSAVNQGDQFTVDPPAPAPTVTGLNISSGSTAGGDVVEITGSNFTGATGVSFVIPASDGNPAVAVAAQQFVVTSDTTIVAETPAGTDGSTVDVTVTTGSGTSSTSPVDQFTYQTPVTTGPSGTGPDASLLPTVTGLGASSGSGAGGEPLQIFGTNFAGATGVSFVVPASGGNPAIPLAATSFSVVSDTEIDAVVPSWATLPASPVDVIVQNLAGASLPTAADQFQYNAPADPPTVTGLSASAGSTTGGSPLVITGTKFTDVTDVSFVVPASGGNPAVAIPAASYTVVSPTEIDAIAPADTGDAPDGSPVDVIVTNTGGSSATSPADQFTFSSAAPVVTSLSSSSGFANGGDTIVISGVNLDQATGVFFGGVAASAFTVNDDGTISAVTPAAVGQVSNLPVDVTVQTPVASSAPDTADEFIYTPDGALPTVDSLSTNTGSVAGGQLLIITGSNFTDVTGVSFVIPASGGNPATSVAATSFEIDSPTTIVAVAPAIPVSAPGTTTLDVTVTTTSGTSATSPADQYSVTAAAPVITGLSETSDFAAGEDVITISGTGLTGATAVSFVVPPSGGNPAVAIPASAFSVSSDGAITATVPDMDSPPSQGGSGGSENSAPLSAPQTVDITVVTPLGSSALTTADQFTFTPDGALPTVTGLNTSTVSTAGGTSITIIGSNFTHVSGVAFVAPASGGNPAVATPAASYQVVSATEIIAVAPVGQVSNLPDDIVVTTDTGSSATSSADQVTYQVPVPTVTGVSVASGVGQAVPAAGDGSSSSTTGSTAGGDTVTITGTNLAGATSVLFGSMPAASFTQNADGSLTAISPIGTSGTVDVQVVTPYGTSAPSSSDQFTYADPSAGGSSGTGTTPATGTGTGQTIMVGVPGFTGILPDGTFAPLGPTMFTTAWGTYTVQQWPLGQPGGSGPAYSDGSGASDAAAGLMSSFTPPMPPMVPTLHPTYSYSTSSWSMSDGGTVNYNFDTNQTEADGATYVVHWVDTVTFSISQNQTFPTMGTDGIPTGSFSSSLYVYRQDKVSLSQQYTAVDGTGFSRVDLETASVTFNHTSTSSNNLDQYVVDSFVQTTSEEQQRGLGPLGPAAGIALNYEDDANDTRKSHFDSTVSSSGTTVNVNGSNVGSDDYDHNNVGSTATTAADDDLLAGNDWWNDGNVGNFTQNTNGATAGNQFSVMGGGNDFYFDDDTLTTTTTSGDPVLSGNWTVLVDNQKTLDTGNDTYSIFASGTASRATDGTVTASDTVEDTDSGKEDDNVGDFGTVDSQQINADGSVVTAHDEFDDSNDDQSNYSDGDEEQVGPALEAAGSTTTPLGGTDFLNTQDGDNDKFHSQDKEHVVLTSVATSGGVTKITYDDQAGDDGTLEDGDYLFDDETLQTATAGQTDDDEFDDWADEQDTAYDNGQIVVNMLGNMAPNTYVNSTETLTGNDTVKTQDDIDDPGTEDDTSTDDSEQDQETEKLNVLGNLTLGDVLDSLQAVTGADGSITKTIIHNRNSDNINTTVNDWLSDQHSADTPNPNATFTPVEIDTDNTKYDDKTGYKDIATGNANISLSVWQPVVAGVLSTVSSLIANGNDTFTDTDRDQGSGNVTAPLVAGSAASSDDEWDTDIDDETDQSGGQSLENDYSLLTTTDPTTGVVTNLYTGDSVQDKSSGQAGTHDSDTSNSNIATTLSQGPPTVTVNNGNGTDIETDYSLGNDTTKTGGNISLSVVGSPAAGQTENINEKIQLGGNDQYQENSNGGSEEDSSSSYNGTPGTATSSDTLSVNETLKDKDIGNQTVGIIGNSTISILDPTTNLTTTDTLIDNGSLKVGYNGNDTLTDNDPLSDTSASEDDLANDDQMKETLSGKDQSTETLTVNGTTPDGTTVSSTETIGDKSTLIGNTTDHDTGNTTIAQPLSLNLSVTESDTDDLRRRHQNRRPDDGHAGLPILRHRPHHRPAAVGDHRRQQHRSGERRRNRQRHRHRIQLDRERGHRRYVVATDDDNFDDKLIESGQSTDNPLIVINTQGTDSQGEQVNSQEIILLNGNATATVNDEDIGEDTSGIAGKPATADTETVDADVLSHATVEDVLGGSIVSVDPNTGIKTTTTDNLSITGTDDEHDHEDETDSQSDGVGQDTLTQTNTDPLVLVWVITESVISALPDGSQAAPPTDNTNSGNATVTANDTLTNGANGQITGAPTASDPSSANEFAQNASPLVNVGGQQSGVAGPKIIGESASGVAETGLEDETGFVEAEVGAKEAQNAALPKALPGGSDNSASGTNGAGGNSTGWSASSDNFGPYITIGTSQAHSGLIVPGLDPKYGSQFLDMVKQGSQLQDEAESIVNTIRDLTAQKAKLLQSWSSDAAKYKGRLAIDAEISSQRDQLLGLQTRGNALAQAYYDAGFEDVDVFGYPRGKNDAAQRGTPVYGVGFAGAVEAYRNSLTYVDAQGLESAESPIEFAVMTVGPGLVAKAAGKAAAAAAIAGAAARQAPARVLRLRAPLVLAGREGKLVQHAVDWGIGTKGNAPSGAADLVAAIARHIYNRATQMRQGQWRDIADALFYYKNGQIVVTKPDGTLITILKNAGKNKWFNNASIIW